MKKFKLILKIMLIPILAVWGVFFNIIAGAGIITSGYYKIGISLLIITVVGYIGASILCWCNLHITAAALSIFSSTWLLFLRNDFLNIPFKAKSAEELFNIRHLPSILITFIITVLALDKIVRLRKEKKKNVTKKEQARAPSIFSDPKKSIDK